MNLKLRHLPNLAVAVLIVLISTSTHAGEKPEDVTNAERALLPSYCPHTMGERGHVQPHIGKWTAIMGDGFFHMHHHCWALIDFHRAQRTGMDKYERRHLLGRALGGFNYVVRNVKDDFILLPEILTWAGRTEVVLGQGKDAAKSFSRAITLKSDYWPPYYHFADLLKRNGQSAKAKEILIQGLQHSPNAKPLQLLFAELGGKPTEIPPPIVATDAAQKPASAPSAETPASISSEAEQAPKPN